MPCISGQTTMETTLITVISPLGARIPVHAATNKNSYSALVFEKFLVRFSKKTMRGQNGQFTKWRCELGDTSEIVANPIKPAKPYDPTVKPEHQHLYDSYAKAVYEFEHAYKVFKLAEMEWLETGTWPSDKRDASKNYETKCQAMCIARDKFYGRDKES